MNRWRDEARCLRIRGDPPRNPSCAETTLLGPPPRASRILHGGLHRSLFVLLALGASWACGSDDPYRPDPQATFSPRGLAFEMTAIGDTARRTVSLTSRFPRDFEVTVGSNSPEFSVEGPEVFTLGAGKTRELVVRFHPATKGAKQGRVEVEGIRCDPLPCSGTADDDPCRVEPMELAFGWVKEDGGGDAPTVQAAIDSAGPGDVVVVGPGRYYENIDLLGKGIHLRSAEGPERTIVWGRRRSFRGTSSRET